MKVVKLNRRFRQFRDAGHVVGLRFASYGARAIAAERLCRERLGGNAWDRSADWCGYFGVSNGHSTRRTYWITFRNPADLTLVLLSTDLTKIG